MVKDLSGKKLESLVATLERTLSGSHATIESPSRRLRDRDTGKPREHDVVIAWDHGHHQIIMAIECRDRSRPVGVPDIEAFADKCRTTGVDKGVIVSSTGFRKTALEKASARSITCMELEEVEQFDWLSPDFTFVCYERAFGQMSVQLMFCGDPPSDIGRVFDAEGIELTALQISQSIANSVPQWENPEDFVGKNIRLHLHVQTTGWTMHDHEGRVWAIDHVLAETTATMTKSASDVQRHRYKGGGKDYHVATVDAPIGTMQSKFVFVRNEDDSTSVFLTPDHSTQSSPRSR